MKHLRYTEKKRIALVSMLVSLTILSLFVASVAAAPEISVQVNGQDLGNGEEMEVDQNPIIDVEITSEDVIDFVDIELPSGRSVDGVNEQTYNETFDATLGLGSNTIAIRARDQTGEESNYSATLTRDPETTAEVREYLNNLESRVNRLEEDNQELKRYREDLQQENQNLSERNEELRKRIEEENSLLPLPGMTALLAILAFISVIAATKIGYRR